jgi:hypothetical protein
MPEDSYKRIIVIGGGFDRFIKGIEKLTGYNKGLISEGAGQA